MLRIGSSRDEPMETKGSIEVYNTHTYIMMYDDDDDDDNHDEEMCFHIHKVPTTWEVLTSWLNTIKFGASNKYSQITLSSGWN